MSLAETRRDQIYPTFELAQIQAAKRFASGPARCIAQGQVVFGIGEQNVPAWLVLEGSIEITRRDGHDHCCACLPRT